MPSGKRTNHLLPLQSGVGINSPRNIPEFAIDYDFRIPFGATGAPGTPENGPMAGGSALTVTRASAGLYNLANIPQGDRYAFQLQKLEVTPTANTWAVTAFNAAAGTAQIASVNGSAVATDPANGSSLYVRLHVEGR